MLNFTKFLVEQEEAKKLKHLEHLEDLHINDGKVGFNHAVEVLRKTKNHVESGKSSPDVTVKYDGSPSVVYGHHPETGKFFVASKSAFSKDPKINYTPEDIEKNHGHAPGLVAKLKSALEHLSQNKEHFTNAINTYKHLQGAKDILVHHMNKQYSGFEHHIEGKASSPEGYVTSHKGELTKLVDRREFSAANLAKG